MDRLAGAAELLDGPLDDPAALVGNLRDLSRVNRLLGGVSLSGRGLDALAGRLADAGTAVSLLDVGTGGADIPLALLDDWRRRGRRLNVTAVDDRPEVLAAARVADPRASGAAGLTLEQADGRSLPYPDGSFDVAHCSLVLHHLEPADALTLLRELGRVARLGVVVNDLARGRMAWVGARLLAALGTGNRYSRKDGPLSVRRAYTIAEAHGMLAAAGLRPVAELTALFGHRWAIAAVRK
ncbi:MAG: methyltransferase domain-containing protein [Chloroflexota bacterium]|nr:methyltransferase domain-containing protein [Chloroflexota bacterium]